MAIKLLALVTACCALSCTSQTKDTTDPYYQVEWIGANAKKAAARHIKVPAAQVGIMHALWKEGKVGPVTGPYYNK